MSVEVITIVALILGPSLAVSVGEIIEKKRAKYNLFKELLVRRASFPDPNFIYAMNSIVPTFPRNKKIREKWKEFIDHVSQETSVMPEADLKVWFDKLDGLIIDLLDLVAKKVGYRATRLELKKELWLPKFFQQYAQNQEALTQILTGQKAIKVELSSNIKAEEQKVIQDNLISYLKGEKAIKVIVQSENKK